jgi:hypothetical protein
MSSWFEDGDRFEVPSSPGSAAAMMLNCPITLAANQALRSCKTTRCALQNLRDCLINCPDCPAVANCELNEHFNQLVDQAVAAIREEWGW